MTHGPVQQEFVDALNSLAKHIDEVLNPDWTKGSSKRVGFALLTYHFGRDLQGTGRVNYIGNGKREDILVALKELIARWEGRYPEESITKQ